MNTSLLKMIQICDSLFPIGAFTLSNGLETFVNNGQISTAENLEEYINSYLQILPYNDLGVMALAYAHAENRDYIEMLNQLSIIYKIPMEVRDGSRKLCSRFLKLWENIKEYDSLRKYQQLPEGNYAIAVGLYAKEIGIAIADGVSMYAYSLLTAMVTNAVKTVPLSQKDGQRILFEVQEKLPAVCEKSMRITMDDLGIGGTESDIAAMNHETLYSRLYMS